jgi:hydroxypyruvate reductase
MVEIKSDINEVFRAALDRANPYKMISDNVSVNGDILEVKSGLEIKRIDLSAFEKIIVTGVGKATARMALAVEEVLDKKITGGLISVKKGHTEKLEHIEIIEAEHPVPGEKSLEAGKRIRDVHLEGDEKTLFINLISGGGSALYCNPVTTDKLSLSLSEKQETTRILLSCGADIHELNTVRKHLSDVKGGKTAAAMYPATSVNIILSDVVGDDLSVIASGITAPDNSTFKDTKEIFMKYRIYDELPENVKKVVELGCKGVIADTPDETDKVFSKVNNVLLGTNTDALISAGEHAKTLGYETYILSSSITGEAREIAKFFSALARDGRTLFSKSENPLCIIGGGETTVTIRGKGKGGRNQEMALSFLDEIRRSPEQFKECCFLSGGTDGNDGPTDAAGAYASLEILEKSCKESLNIIEYLSNNDSYHFFKKCGGLLMTGATNTNVGDVQIIILR